MAQLFDEPVVECLTHDEIARGLAAVILAHEYWGGRCTVCNEDNTDAHDGHDHQFAPLDTVDVFLTAARAQVDKVPREATG